MPRLFKILRFANITNNEKEKQMPPLPEIGKSR
jgi:hypothetical protein